MGVRERLIQILPGRRLSFTGNAYAMRPKILAANWDLCLVVHTKLVRSSSPQSRLSLQELFDESRHGLRPLLLYPVTGTVD